MHRPRTPRGKRGDERSQLVHWLSPTVQHRRLGEIWYAFTLDRIPEASESHSKIREALFGMRLSDLSQNDKGRYKLAAAYGMFGILAAKKRQLSKREIRAHPKRLNARKSMEVL